MKLIFCKECYDVRKLLYEEVTCFCGQSWGKYTDNLNAVIGGKAIPIGIANSDFYKAIINQPETGLGERFDAFVIPKICPTIKKE